MILFGAMGGVVNRFRVMMSVVKVTDPVLFVIKRYFVDTCSQIDFRLCSLGFEEIFVLFRNESLKGC